MKHVDSETAKWLKEKGFNKECKQIFYGDSDDEDLLKNNEPNIPSNNYVLSEFDCYAPIISDVVDWLSEKHGIWVQVEPDYCGDLWYVILKVCSKEVWENINKRHEIISAHRKFINEHKSPKEAYQAAFNYIRNNNLI